MSFSDLGLSENVLRAVTDAGYTEPTPIQRQAIPHVLMGRDILGCAQTGTGKTASFTLPMIDILSAGKAKARMPRSLILEPTRELAAQVAENFDTYGKYVKLSKALLIGGESMGQQIKVIDRGPDVLIATPGRLLDLFERGRLLMTDVRHLVIDEADRMLDMGFIPDVERICSLLSPMRTTLLFSATMPPEIRRLAEKFLMNPKEISVAPPSTTAETIEQGLAMLDAGGARLRPGETTPALQAKKRAALRALIDGKDVKNALVFCNRKRDVSIVSRSLLGHGYNAGQLHGDMVQSLRTETLEKFKSGGITFLVCSDVAARGLDIVNMSHVFNFDVPIHAEDYVHRIGRTGRAGKQGRAFSIGTPADVKSLAEIERLIGKPIPRLNLPGLTANESKAASSASAAPAPAAPASAERPQPAEKPRRARTSRPPRGGGEARASRESQEAREPREARAPREAQAPREVREPQKASDGGGAGADSSADNGERGERGGRSPKPRQPSQPRHSGGGGDTSGGSERPAGFGDHVPAFLR
ncbi:MAG: DEAD/DEAH box helicase [Rhodospirillales bacterium]